MGKKKATKNKYKVRSGHGLKGKIVLTTTSYSKAVKKFLSEAKAGRWAQIGFDSPWAGWIIVKK